MVIILKNRSSPIRERKIMSKKISLTKRDMIRQIAELSGHKINETELIWDTFEDVVVKYLKYAKEHKKDVEIKILNGVTINGRFKPEEEKVNNIDGEKHIVEDRLTVSSQVSRRFKDKINSKK